MTAVKYLDLILLALVLPIFLLGNLPILGWATAAGAWLLQRGLQLWTARKARASDDPRTVVGITAGSMIGRGWLVAGIILAVGLSNSSAGLAAAVLILVLFTAYFTVGMITRPFHEPNGAHQ